MNNKVLNLAPRAKLLPAFLIVWLNVVDYLLTDIGLKNGLEESNPVMSFLFQSHGTAWAVKLIVNLAFILWVLTQDINERFIRMMWFIVGFFTATAIVNFSIIMAI